MAVTAVVGANWGDEGKGKMVDYLAETSDVVVRFQGGSNAGHTVINKFGKFALHLLPSGVFYPGVTNILGPGVAVDIEEFAREYEGLVSKGVPPPRILVSERAQVMLPYHRLFDEYEEERLAERQFGSTKSGIAPFYSDKYAKIGVQLCQLFDEAELRKQLAPTIRMKNALLEHLYKKPLLDLNQLVEQLCIQGEKIKPYVGDTTAFLHDAFSQGKRVLLEGQLGALRDPDHGIYPFSTSSSTLAGYGAVGAGVPPYAINEIIAVVKAYSSCVGAGPFVTELSGAEAEELRRRGGDSGEYGAKTGRPRRVGWFDSVATRYGCRMQGATSIALTLLDVLGYLDEIPVCVAYDLLGTKVTEFPATPRLTGAKPVFQKIPGWKCDVSSVKTFRELPKEAKDYVAFVEQQAQVPVRWVSVGPRREQTFQI